MVTDPAHPREFRAARLRAGLSQRAVARHLGISRSAVSLYEMTGGHVGLAKVMRALRYMRTQGMPETTGRDERLSAFVRQHRELIRELIMLARVDPRAESLISDLSGYCELTVPQLKLGASIIRRHTGKRLSIEPEAG